VRARNAYLRRSADQNNYEVKGNAQSFVGASFELIGGTGPKAPFDANGLPVFANATGGAHGRLDNYIGAGLDSGLLTYTITSFTPAPLPPGALVAKLLREVTGVGPGKRLAHDIELIQTYFDAHDGQAACAALTRFVDEVKAKNGKKIAPTLDAQIISDAQTLEVSIGCNCDERHDRDEERKCDDRRDCEKQNHSDDKRDG
jgi:hypothetical protein